MKVYPNENIFLFMDKVREYKKTKRTSITDAELSEWHLLVYNKPYFRGCCNSSERVFKNLLNIFNEYVRQGIKRPEPEVNLTEEEQRIPFETLEAEKEINTNYYDS